MRGIQESLRSEDAPIANLIIGIDQKKCRKCNEIKNRTEFPKSKQAKDGLYTYCKECNNKKRANWYDKNSEIALQKAKIYRAKNIEKITKRQLNWYQVNKEAILEGKKVYWEENKDEINRKRREELQNNPEKRAARNLKTKIWHEENKEQVKRKQEEYFEKNKDEIRAKARERNNSLDREQRDILNAKVRTWWAKNSDTLNEKLRARRKADITRRLSNNISTAIRHSVRGKKSGRHWEGLVGYTMNDLMVHIENLFTDGMTWEHFMKGNIHIDHKIPLILFSFTSPEDEQFRKAWSLKNLQPLWASDNLKKNDKILYPELFFELLG